MEVGLAVALAMNQEVMYEGRGGWRGGRAVASERKGRLKVSRPEKGFF